MPIVRRAAEHRPVPISELDVAELGRLNSADKITVRLREILRDLVADRTALGEEVRMEILAGDAAGLKLNRSKVAMLRSVRVLVQRLTVPVVLFTTRWRVTTDHGVGRAGDRLGPEAAEAEMLASLAAAGATALSSQAQRGAGGRQRGQQGRTFYYRIVEFRCRDLAAVKDRMIALVRDGLLRYAYVTDAELVRGPLQIEEPEAADLLDRPRGRESGRRVDVIEGECCIAALFKALEFNRSGEPAHVGRGKGAKKITMELVRETAVEVTGSDKWLTLRQMSDVAKRLGAPSFRAFSEHAIHEAVNCSRPLVHNEWEQAKGPHAKRDVTVIAYADHVVAANYAPPVRGQHLDATSPGGYAFDRINGPFIDVSGATAVVDLIKLVQSDRVPNGTIVRVGGEEGNETAVHDAYVYLARCGVTMPVRAVDTNAGTITAFVYRPMEMLMRAIVMDEESSDPMKEVLVCLSTDIHLDAHDQNKLLAGVLGIEFRGQSTHAVALEKLREHFHNGYMSPSVLAHVDNSMRFSTVGWNSHPLPLTPRPATFDLTSAFVSSIVRPDFALPDLHLNDEFRPYPPLDGKRRIQDYGLYLIVAGAERYGCEHEQAWRPPLILGNGVYVGAVVRRALLDGMPRVWIRMACVASAGPIDICKPENINSRKDVIRRLADAILATAPAEYGPEDDEGNLPRLVGMRSVKSILLSAIGLTRRSTRSGGERVEAIGTDRKLVSADRAYWKAQGRRCAMGEIPVADDRSIYYLTSSKKDAKIRNIALLNAFCVQLSNLALLETVDRLVVGGWKNVLATATDSFACAAEHLTVAGRLVRLATPDGGVPLPVVRDGKSYVNALGSVRPTDPIAITHAAKPPSDDPTASVEGQIIRCRVEAAEMIISKLRCIHPRGVENMPLFQAGSGRTILVTAAAGYGKTYGLAQLVKRTLAVGKTALVTSARHVPARALASEIGGAVSVKTAAAARGLMAGGPDGVRAGMGGQCPSRGWTAATDLVVIDECFLLDQSDWVRIRGLRQAYPKATLVLVGDPDQLDPVECEAVRPDSHFLRSFIDIWYTLTVNRRQRSDDPDASALAKVCDAVRVAMSPLRRTSEGGDEREVKKKAIEEALRPLMVRGIAANAANAANTAIVFTNMTRTRVNCEIDARRRLGAATLSPFTIDGRRFHDFKSYAHRAANERRGLLYLGQRFAVCSNSTFLAPLSPVFMNGTICEIVGRESHGLHGYALRDVLSGATADLAPAHLMMLADLVENEHEAAKREQPLEFASQKMAIRLGYALTCHAAQGATLHDGFDVYEHEAGLRMKGWLYTALSRGTALSKIRLVVESRPSPPGAPAPAPGEDANNNE